MKDQLNFFNQVILNFLLGFHKIELKHRKFTPKKNLSRSAKIFLPDFELSPAVNTFCHRHFVFLTES